jgi:fatty-acid desaturase
MNIIKNKPLINVLFYTVPIHLIGLFSLIHLFYTSNYIYLFSALIFYFIFGCIGMTVGLHRYWSHNSFKLSKMKEVIITTLGVFNGYGSIFPWILIHESGHHMNSDKEIDPHTPKKGFWYSFLYWHKNQKTFDDLIKRDTILRYTKRRLLTNRYYIILNDYHILINISIFLLIGIVFNWQLAFYGFILGIWFTLLNMCAITTICHMPKFGYVNYDTRDNSRNSKIGAFLTWGEMLHNNHHRFWKSTSMSRHWSEIDIGGFMIKLLRTDNRV